MLLVWFVLNCNKSIVEINKTYITLVAKTKSPTKMVYKLISKVLANRLKAILPHLITENQSVFLSKRLITDNVLVAFEVMHYLEHKRDGKDYYMAVKLDMSKAYDRVEWGFIEKVMERTGFHERWIGLVMHCISTVSYSILINGVAYPSR